MNRCILFSVLFFSLLTTSVSLKAEEKKNPYLWKPQTKSVAVFKNGLAFYIREGETSLRDGWCVAEHIPPAAFGTLAVFANDERKTVDVIGAGPGEIFEFDDRDRSKDFETKKKHLELSLHLRVELKYRSQGTVKAAAGEIVQVGSEFVILDNGTNNFAVPIKDITRMQALGLPLRLHVADDESEENSGENAEKLLEKVGDDSEKISIGMAYLTKGGIIWIPEYTFRMIDDENAELTLRGTVINEGEDLIHADVHLVVGVPHFVHSDLMTPIAIGQTIRTIGSALTNNIPQGVMTQSIMGRAAFVQNTAQVVSPDSRDPFESGSAEYTERNLDGIIGNLPQLESAAGSDFTVYTKEDMTLRRGEKAIITLFTKKVKFSHLYRWTIPGAVQHRLIMQNSSDTPWTTGPCLVLSPERQPLSEDILNYTALGGRCELPITSAINMATDKKEKEVERATKKYSPNNNSTYYDLVTLEGRMTVQSFEKKTVEVQVDATVPGTPTEMEENGTATMNPDKLRLLEKEADIHWKFEIKPGEKKTIKYLYERYVPSN